jgi:hypothetical protein
MLFFIPKGWKKLGIISIVVLPAIIFASWFADIYNLIKSIKLKKTFTKESKGNIRRVSLGILISLPILFIFTLLLSSADLAFGDLIADWSGNFLDELIDGDTFGKILMGGIVAVYFAVFNFSLWNPNSALKYFTEQYSDSKTLAINKNWDSLTASVVLTLINLLFILFVAVQFFYLFAGKGNVIGENANYTYAEYARRGFKELLLVSVLIYAVAYLLNLKVDLKSKVLGIYYRVNFVLLLLLTLVISFSAQMRLTLAESTYGFTDVRLFGHFIMTFVAVSLVTLLVLSFYNDSVKYINRINLVYVFIAFVTVLLIPSDYVIARANYARYIDKNQIDLPYMLNLSDEAIPVLVEFYNNEDVPQITRAIIRAELGSRKIQIDQSRLLWQEFNFFDQYNKELLGNLFSKDEDYYSEAEGTLEEFLEGYRNALIEDGYDYAYANYWSYNTDNIIDDRLLDIEVVDFEYISVPEFEDWSIVNLPKVNFGDTPEFDYWVGMTIPTKVKYSYQDNYGETFITCRYDSVRVKLEDGEWRVMYSDELPLGNFKDEGNTRYYYEKSNYDHLYNGYVEICD